MTTAHPTAACGCAAPPRAARVRSAGRHLPVLPALALVMLPKCPLCLAAYFGILGSIGASSWVRAAWGLPLGLGLLALSIGALALRGRSLADYRPAALGLAGAAALLGGKFLLDVAPLVFAGAAAVAGASIWSARLRRSPGGPGRRGGGEATLRVPRWPAGRSRRTTTSASSGVAGRS